MRVNKLLEELGMLCSRFLRERRFRAKTLPPTVSSLDYADLATPLPHKTVATRAGLGWVGKCALLVTREYGSALRITTVLTDADLATNEPIEVPECGECNECVEVCPGHAATGKCWEPSLPRDALLDAFACHKTAKNLARQAGIEIGNVICGMCIAACPWTKEYIKRSCPDNLG